jgi:hypothetical protein
MSRIYSHLRSVRPPAELFGFTLREIEDFDLAALSEALDADTGAIYLAMNEKEPARHSPGATSPTSLAAVSTRACSPG